MPKDEANSPRRNSHDHKPYSPPRSPKIARELREKLEEAYKLDTFPYMTALERIAQRLELSFEETCNWFAKKRAENVGIFSGYIFNHVEGCTDILARAHEAAEFGDGVQRSMEIKRAQELSSMLAAERGGNEAAGFLLSDANEDVMLIDSASVSEAGIDDAHVKDMIGYINTTQLEPDEGTEGTEPLGDLSGLDDTNYGKFRYDDFLVEDFVTELCDTAYTSEELTLSTVAAS